jgi:uncharacterized protein YfaS (alpha-2-macroglobulin family)
MQSYLDNHLLGTSIEPEVQAAIAQSLAEVGELPPSAADPLWDRREQQSVFGLASLAIALSTLPSQKDRVAQLLDELEKSFDEKGMMSRPAKSNDFHYFGSDTRSRAQAAMALERLRNKSKLLPRLVNDLADDIGSYTTQATAYSLLALAQQLVGETGAGADVRALLDGAPLTASRDLGFGAKEFKVPISSLRGKTARLRLEGAGDKAIGFRVSARWRRPAPLGASSEGGGAALAATSAVHGPDVYRVYTDVKGGAVDLAHVKAGDVLRVAVLVKMPATAGGGRDRTGYLAVTDRLPAGFEAVQPDLATVASVPEISSSHPLADLLRSGELSASHVELRDDRVQLYFDRVWGDYVAASYLVRASTPGTFMAPPTMAELMYEGGSAAYGDATKVVVQ